MKKAFASLAVLALSANSFGENWETKELPRDVLFVVSVRGGGKNAAETLKEAFKPPKEADENVIRMLSNCKGPSVPIYSELTFDGAPDATGKRPFVYVMGPTGTTPLFQGTLDAKGEKGAKVAVSEAKKKMPKGWDPFFGTLDEEQRAKYPLLLKALEKGKTAKMSPIAPAVKVIQKDIVSKDAEKATEAQILYDALEQTRSDLLMRIKLEYGACPHRAVYDMQQLAKFWPSEKKRVDMIAAKLKANPEAAKLAQIFCKVMAWSDPEFTCKNAGEAKKIVAELNKMKKDLEKLKESKTIVVQNGALLMDGQLDTLISDIPTRLPEK